MFGTAVECPACRRASSFLRSSPLMAPSPGIVCVVVWVVMGVTVVPVLLARVVIGVVTVLVLPLGVRMTVVARVVCVPVGVCC